MSVSSGPRTAPLARMRGATAAGAMTRIRYVSRVPGPCIGIVTLNIAPIARATREALVDDDPPMRVLELRPAPRPAPALAGSPSGQQPIAQGGGDPQRPPAG